MVDKKLLKNLLDSYGASGSEDQVRSFILKEIKPYVDDIKVDRSGNLIAHQKGPAPRVMLAAHMDEVGLMIKSIDNHGRLYIDTIGDIDVLSLIGQRVNIIANKKEIQGIISTKKFSEGGETEELPEMHDIFVDTGLNKRELNKRGVRIGKYAHLVQENVTLGNDKIICGKALDDRIGCYILIELIKKCKKIAKNEMFFVFTIQEELGLYGAKTSAYEVKPDWAIAVDVTDADDLGISDYPAKVLGNGATITVKDAEMLGNRCINGWLEDIAKKNKIPIQFDVSSSGTTDALSIYFSRGGVPSTVVGIPIRNIHSTVGIAHLDDVDNAIKLLGKLLAKPPKVCIV